jgi:hypothetical protein
VLSPCDCCFACQSSRAVLLVRKITEGSFDLSDRAREILMTFNLSLSCGQFAYHYLCHKWVFDVDKTSRNGNAFLKEVGRLQTFANKAN